MVSRALGSHCERAQEWRTIASLFACGHAALEVLLVDFKERARASGSGAWSEARPLAAPDGSTTCTWFPMISESENRFSSLV